MPTHVLLLQSIMECYATPATLEGSNILWHIVAPPPPSTPFCVFLCLFHPIWFSRPVWLEMFELSPFSNINEGVEL